ncbi:MAG: NAD(P)/FAD-dependent oxidoreductase [Burkholderiales bacterium]|jgi:predicted NAD/FAD-dependent oxidoreductase
MKHTAVIGAGMAGISLARTLMQAGHQVSVFEKSHGAGGRMATRNTPYGHFDHGVQYFTIRDPQFMHAITSVPGTPEICRPWSANAVRVLDPLGRVIEAPLPLREPHFVAAPGMNSLLRHWAQPLETAQALHLESQVQFLRQSTVGGKSWDMVCSDGAVHTGFDHVVLAIPHVQADYLLRQSGAPATGFAGLSDMADVEVAPCWTLMLAFPLAQPTMNHLGPQWNAARSTHHRVAWICRESSKPGRSSVERWTVQASAQWSQHHLEDDAERVQAKLLKAFSELTGIRAEPGFARTHLWRYAKTVKPLGKKHLWDPRLNIGVCGDWLLGHRVEDAFVSGLSLALHLADKSH